MRAVIVTNRSNVAISIIITLITVVFSIGYIFLNIPIKRIGYPQLFICDYVQKRWQKKLEYNKNHRNSSKNYMLLEYGSISFGNYFYYLVDLDTKSAESNYPKKRLYLDENKMTKIQNLLNQISKRNMIYDGTYFARDDNVYILNYYKDGKLIKFGSYSLSYNRKDYRNQRIYIKGKYNKIILRKFLNIFFNNIFKM